MEVGYNRKIILLAAVSLLIPNLSRADEINVSSAEITLGRPAQYTYDAVGSMTNVTDSTGRTVQYQYDSVGTTTPNATTPYTYDNHDITTPHYDSGGHVTNYTYEERGDIDNTTTTPTYDDSSAEDSKSKDGVTIQNTYDTAAETDVTDPLITTRYTYDPNIGVTDVRGGDQSNITTTYTYEPIFNTIHTMTEATGADKSTASGDITFRTTYQYYDARGSIVPGTGGDVTVELDDLQPGRPEGSSDTPHHDSTGTTSGAYGDAQQFARNRRWAALFGRNSMPPIPIVYTYTYDTNGAGIANFDLGLSVPLPSSASAGAVLLGAISLLRFARVRRVSAIIHWADQKHPCAERRLKN